MHLINLQLTISNLTMLLYTSTYILKAVNHWKGQKALPLYKVLFTVYSQQTDRVTEDGQS